MGPLLLFAPRAGGVFVDEEGGTILADIQWDSDGSATGELLWDYTLGAGVLTLEASQGGSTYVFTLTS
ncbi:MAG: hypothetical protein PVJ80_14960 [Gemmatimonadota bacterium]|jgi:hypothetical protein